MTTTATTTISQKQVFYNWLEAHSDRRSNLTVYDNGTLAWSAVDSLDSLVDFHNVDEDIEKGSLFDPGEDRAFIYPEGQELYYEITLLPGNGDGVEDDHGNEASLSQGEYAVAKGWECLVFACVGLESEHHPALKDDPELLELAEGNLEKFDFDDFEAFLKGNDDYRSLVGAVSCVQDNDQLNLTWMTSIFAKEGSVVAFQEAFKAYLK